ncbi:hypothetical protein HK100_002759 [Physocladia obscura]|uniref:histidine kinase n=1 Tax=Physocladia obscura TaxID=109957 RepID=A0AAD5SV76_9FUNG|nr:hypothetical protein HK100_002759 [Physocladia obscura]
MSQISPAGLFILDARGKIIFANAKYMQLFGYDCRECTVDLPAESQANLAEVEFLTSCILEEDKNRILKIWEESIACRTPIINLELQVCPPKVNKNIWIQVNTLVHEEQHRKILHIGCLLDITQRKLLEAERLHSLEIEQELHKKRVEEALESKAESEKFIDMVCHELRNPLNGIRNSNALVGDLIGELVNITENFKDVSLPTIQSLIERFQECYNAIEICAKHQQTTAFKPKDLLESILSTFKAEMKSRKIKLAIKIEDSFIKYINSEFLGDPSRISQILINFVSNASKFTQKSAKKAIEVCLGTEAYSNPKLDSATSTTAVATLPGANMQDSKFGSTDSVLDEDGSIYGEANLTIAVVDSGIGMTEQELALIFNQFRQASSKTYAEYGGSGLGLFISKRLIDMMQGTINVESKKEEGTTFKISLPMKYRLMKPQTRNPNQKNQFSKYIDLNPSPTVSRQNSGKLKDNSRKVLVVDDNDINRMVLKKFLAKLEYDTIQAVNGQDAYELYDLEMPVLNGQESVAKIREFESSINEPAVPIVAVTGNARTEQGNEAISAGMNDILLKPFTRDQFSA